MTFSLHPLVLFLLPLGSAADDPSGAPPQGMDMRPAPELKKLEPLIGTWEGEGMSRQSPDAPEIRWTGRERVAWALGGHFAESNATITFPGGEIPPLKFRSFMGYDRERGRHVSIGANSMGRAGLREIHWSPDGAIVVVTSGLEEGLPTCDREILRVGKDSLEFVIEHAVGTGPFHLYVKGSMRRAADRGVAEPAAGSVAAPAAAKPEIGKLARLLGTWQVKGTMIPAPGAPQVPISGRESYELDFGGAVLVSHVVGDPSAMGAGQPPVSYESWSFLHWNANRKCYEWFFADSMGMSGSAEGWLASADELVACASGPMMGVPSTGRMVVRFIGDVAAPIKVTSDRFYGTSASIRDFEATYTKAK